MRHFNRGVIAACICFVALANVQCRQNGRGNETESPTLTIHVPDQDERVLGPLRRTEPMCIAISTVIE